MRSRSAGVAARVAKRGVALASGAAVGLRVASVMGQVPFRLIQNNTPSGAADLVQAGDGVNGQRKVVFLRGVEGLAKPVAKKIPGGSRCRTIWCFSRARRPKRGRSPPK